jgi:hypothetical protein
MLGHLIAISKFRRRTDLPPAKVIDGDTIIVARQLVRLHGIDTPELDQTFWWRGHQIVCGTMSLAALEALTAAVKVRCGVVERDRHGRQGLLTQPGRHRPQVGVGAAAYRQYPKDYVAARGRGQEGKAGDVAEHLREARCGGWDRRGAQASMPSAPAGTRRQATEARFSKLIGRVTPPEASAMVGP